MEAVPEVISFPTNWDYVFRVIGPHMLGKSNEGELREALNEALEIEFHATEGVEVEVLDQNFQLIKIQLMALGLIRSIDDEASRPTSGESAWTLTPYGRRHLMELMAIRKPKPRS